LPAARQPPANSRRPNISNDGRRKERVGNHTEAHALDHSAEALVGRGSALLHEHVVACANVALAAGEKLIFML
jgi:hypothetical protein